MFNKAHLKTAKEPNLKLLTSGRELHMLETWSMDWLDILGSSVETTFTCVYRELACLLACAFFMLNCMIIRFPVVLKFYLCGSFCFHHASVLKSYHQLLWVKGHGNHEGRCLYNTYCVLFKMLLPCFVQLSFSPPPGDAKPTSEQNLIAFLNKVRLGNTCFRNNVCW